MEQHDAEFMIVPIIKAPCHFRVFFLSNSCNKLLLKQCHTGYNENHYMLSEKASACIEYVIALHNCKNSDIFKAELFSISTISQVTCEVIYTVLTC